MLRLLAGLRGLGFSNIKQKVQSIPDIKQFMSLQNGTSPLEPNSAEPYSGVRSTYYIQSYGCQMNASDTELVRSILSHRYAETNEENKAEIVMLNTCAIRESAEQKIYQRVNELKKNKIVAVLGCMAERVKEKMIEHGVHIVCGPDSYRELPKLIEVAKSGDVAIDVQLSVEETYGEITPIRKNPNAVQAYISIMRGCNNMCSFCIVPFVRGRERSRNLDSILSEIATLEKQGVKEVTFLGQNVNSYHDTSAEGEQQKHEHRNTQDFVEMYKLRQGPGPRFAQLLQAAAKAFPEMRFRFTSPHPKDFPTEVIDVMAQYPNICKNIHLPFQSGSTEVLKRMRRNHTREAYLNLVRKLKERLPGLTLSTDVICGFCGETEEEFEDTITMLREVKFEMAFLFAYSMRPKTHAHRNYKDDVPAEVKQHRLQRMIKVFLEEQGKPFKQQIGKYHLLLVEGKSKKDAAKLVGRTDGFMRGFFQSKELPTISFENGQQVATQVKRPVKPGDYILVKVTDSSSRSLYCEPLAHMTLQDFARKLPLLQNTIDLQGTANSQPLP